MFPRVIPISCTQVEVHLFRRRGKRMEVLLIRRSPERSLAGVWQPVTGGIERGESAMQAAVREVREETGLAPIRWWALEHMANFYDVARDHVRIVPVFAAEVAWTDPVHLSDEHDRYEFVPIAKAWEQVMWATQRRALEALAEEVLSGSAGGAAREITARVAAFAAKPARQIAKPAMRAKRVTRTTTRTTSRASARKPAKRRTKRA
jgi:8-oxo-dGTP pyrophosphatase MutT (NUDIX family)